MRIFGLGWYRPADVRLRAAVMNLAGHHVQLFLLVISRE
jgi:hypothetical protein